MHMAPWVATKLRKTTPARGHGLCVVQSCFVHRQVHGEVLTLKSVGSSQKADSALLLTSGRNQSMRGGAEEGTCLAGRKNLRAHESSVDEQRQLSSQFVWAFDA